MNKMMNMRISIVDILLIQKLQERMPDIKEVVQIHRSHFIILNNLKSFDEKNAKLRNNLSCPISRRKKVNLDIALNY